MTTTPWRSPTSEAKPFKLPVRGVNNGAPKIRIEDADGVTIAYVPYCNSDYGKQIKDTLAVARVEAIVAAINGTGRLPAYPINVPAGESTVDITTGKVTPSASEATFPPGSLADAIEDAQRMLAETPQKYGGHKPSARSDQGGERVSEHEVDSLVDDLLVASQFHKLETPQRNNDGETMKKAAILLQRLWSLRARSSVSAGGEAVTPQRAIEVLRNQRGYGVPADVAEVAIAALSRSNE